MVGQVEGRVEPPTAVVVPEVVVGTGGLLPAGDDGWGGVHGDVVVVVHDIAMAGKSERPN